MAEHSEIKGFYVDCERLPENFPTHRHSAEFWEALGRAVGAFGFLEEILGKAIFALTATREMSSDKAEEEYKKWRPTLEKALTDPLGGLITAYEKAANANSNTKTPGLEDRVRQLREAGCWRNVICHGSWAAPDDDGRSIPLFVSKKCEIWEKPIDVALLTQLRRHVAELSCAVINSVTQTGYQFPGSGGPGKPVF